MSKTKFLPGPWDVDEYVDAIFICTEDNSVIAEVMPKETSSAYLMSAAPDLYAALEEEVRTRCEIRKAIDDYHASTISIYELQHRITGILTGSFVGDKADAALAKARGET